MPFSFSFVPVGDRRAVTLGVVMAHELGHLLLGSHSHSSKGIMCPQWGYQKLEEAYAGRRGFSSDEQKRLRDNLKARLSEGLLSQNIEPRK